MELRIDLESSGKRVTITRDWADFDTGNWNEQAAEIRRACEQAIGTFFAADIGRSQ